MCISKKTFVFIYVAVIRATTGGTEQIRVCVSRYDQSAQDRGQKVFTRGLYVCEGRLDIEKLLKSPLIYSVSYFNLRDLELCPQGRSTKAPRGDGTESAKAPRGDGTESA